MIQWFWTRLTAAIVRNINVLQPHRPAPAGDTAVPVPMASRYPGLEGSGLFLSGVTPPSEAMGFAERLALRFVLAMKEWARLGPAYPEPFDGALAPYPRAFESVAAPPTLPADFSESADAVAGVARRGPFSICTRKNGDRFEIDLTHVEAAAPREGYLRVGGRAVIVRTAGGLRTESITLDGHVARTSDADYASWERRFLAGLNAHLTFIEHLVYCHLITCGPLAMATHAQVPYDHPLRHFLQPFIIETMRVNNDNIDGLILTENSNVPSYTGFPLATLKQMIVTVSRTFDLFVMDPEHRARVQGTLGEPGFVTLESRVRLWHVFQEYSLRYLREGTSGVDAVMIAWCKELDRLVPNGIATYAGVQRWEHVTIEQVARIVALFTYTSSVTHHLVADTTRDYMLSAKRMPPAVLVGGLPRLGMVIEKMNSIVIAGILRYKLHDRGVPFPTDAQRGVWAAFQSALDEVQRDVESDPETRPYRIEPRRVPSSIHA